ncbi:MAG: ATP-binding protein [Kiritimatiellae bacterium]|nr:ATP-binding protein [Kiritimatiellia bacterium]
MIGREKEINELQEAFASDQSEFVAVYGRRRIGKTFLINEMFGGRYAFQHSGVENVGIYDQLDYFRQSISRFGRVKCPKLRNWREAFFELEQMLERGGDGKKVVFIDEAPWLDTVKSGFLPALEHFWNGWASLRKDILLIICGSATSWVVNEILRNRGGLHNRVTKPLPITPFTLKECEEYATWKGLPFDRRQLAECYMAFGGVAYYWSLLSPGQSAAQNFDRLFFAKNAELENEFSRLFASLFKHERKYVEIVSVLASRADGMTRNQLLSKMPSPCGGEISRYLCELEECGFIRRNPIIGTRKKGAIFQLIDNFVLFHFKFLKERVGNDEHFWEISYNKPAINNWRGLSFERICFWHIPQIKRALGISGVLSDVYSWRGETEDSERQKVQIDMLIDRSDHVINICEMKFSADAYVVTDDENRKLRRRLELFRAATGTNKGLMLTMITSNGIKRNANSAIVNSEVTLDDLFT